MTAKMAAIAVRGYCKVPRKSLVDWHSRQGTVCHTTTSNGHTVTIKWDGLKSFDSWPKDAIELVDD